LTEGTRVLRFKGADPARVDPYWDFEHEPGGGYDPHCVRPWRARVFSSGATTAEVRLVRKDDSVETTQSDARLGRLAGDERGEIWKPLDGPRWTLGAPSVLVAADLTGASEGDYVLALEVVGAPAFDRKHPFTVVRRPFYRFVVPAPHADVREAQGPVRAGSTTGLCEVDDDRWLAAAHAWTVIEHRWSGNHYAERALRVVSVTLFDARAVVPVETRFSVRDHDDDLGDWSHAAFTRWAPPSAHALLPDGQSPHRFGLPFPTLVGLPKQPDADGRFGLDAAADSASTA
jgi:hypothetical protein